MQIGVIIVYDVNDQTSFSNIKNWKDEIERYAGNSVQKLLVGNKIDRPNRVIETSTGEDYAKGLGMTFLETSAKNKTNVEQAFMVMSKEIKDAMVSKGIESSPGSRLPTESKRVVPESDGCFC